MKEDNKTTDAVIDARVVCDGFRNERRVRARLQTAYTRMQQALFPTRARARQRVPEPRANTYAIERRGAFASDGD